MEVAGSRSSGTAGAVRGQSGSVRVNGTGVANPPVDGAVFRRVVGNFASGVVVITTSVDGRRFGATVSAVTSLSLDPPMMLACLHAGSSTQEAVLRRGAFAVNVLAEGQTALAGLFARPSAPGADKFDGVPVHDGHTGVPVLDGTLAVIECSVQSTRDGRHAPGVPLAGGARRGHRGFPARVLPGHHGQARHGAGHRRVRRAAAAGAHPRPRAARDPGRPRPRGDGSARRRPPCSTP